MNIGDDNKPSTEAILAELKAASLAATGGRQPALSDDELKSAGLDCLYFMWSIYHNGGKVLYTHRRSPRPVPATFTVPGLIDPRPSGQA